MADIECDVLIVGGGAGGCAAAMAACSLGMRVILTEPTQVLGGQLTSQMVPPDEHPWIEQFGCTARYRDYRRRVRDWYRPKLKGSLARDPFLNPGGGWVSRLCHKPEAGVEVLNDMFAPARAKGLVDVRHGWEPVSVDSEQDRIRTVAFRDSSGDTSTVAAPMTLDGTELGDLLPLARCDYRVGSERAGLFDEPHGTPADEP